MGIIAAYMVPHPPLIVPDIGKGEEKKIQKTVDAFLEVARRIGEQRPDTIVLISPHQVMYGDYFHISPGRRAEGDFRPFRAGQVRMEIDYDTEFTELLCQFAAGEKLSAGTLGEKNPGLDHGTMVPLYFINHYWTGYHLVRIGLSGLPFTEHYRLGQYIQRTADALCKKTIVIGSGDLSHRLKENGPYGYREEGPEYDRRIMEVMEQGAFGELLEFSEQFCEQAGECGHRSFTIMAGALDGQNIRCERMSYEGSFGVGYGICAYEVCGRDPERNFLEQYEEKVRERLDLPYVDAMNIDLKGFREDYYRKLGGELDTVKSFIVRAAADCHVELRTLIVPGENDRLDEIEEEAAWIATVDREIPLHVTRFFPRYHMTDREDTDIKRVYELADAAGRYLPYVYVGNC